MGFEVSVHALIYSKAMFLKNKQEGGSFKEEL